MSVLCLLALGFLAGCGKGADAVSQMEYVPFQMEKDGRWGMVSVDGEILYEDEFDNKPTVAMNGRFLVKNEAGKWEIYTTEKPARKVGGEYLSASLFGADVALVTRGKNKGIELVDLEGNVKCALDDVAGKPVDKARFLPIGLASLLNVPGGCYNGLIEFSVEGKAGCMDAEGKVIVPPEYNVFSSSGKYLLACQGYNTDSLRVRIFDNTGKRLHEYSFYGAKKNEMLQAYWLSDDVFCMAEGAGEKRYRLVGMDGKTLLHPAAGLMPIPPLFPSLGNDPFVFLNVETEERGLMGMDGHVLIRDKYKGFSYFMKEAYIVERDGKLRLVDVKDNPIGNMEFEDVVALGGEDKVLVEREEGEWVFLDNKGQRVGDKLFYAISDDIGDPVVESDYVDFNAVIDSLHITKEGLGPFTLAMSAKACAALTENKLCTDYLNAEPPNLIMTGRYIDRFGIGFIAAFGENVCQDKTRTEYTTLYGWSYSYEVPDGYRFTRTRPDFLMAEVSGGRLTGRMDDLFDAMKDYAKGKKWKVVSEKDGLMVWNIGGMRLGVVLVAPEDGEDALSVALGDKTAIDAVMKAWELFRTAK